MNSEAESAVVVGAGQAGCQVVESLRQFGFRGAITLLGAEAWAPYQRPPLSKKYLTGELPAERLALRPPPFYEKHDIKLELHRQVESLDRQAGSVGLDDGTTLPYSHLALCTGAHPRPLPVPGIDLPGVHYLRGIADVDAIKSRLEGVHEVVVIGAGFIGLETAAALQTLKGDSCRVRVVEARERVMARAVSPDISGFFAELHADHGVELLLQKGVAALHGDKHVREVELDDSDRLPADLCIVGIGVVPNVELAERAGLACDNGIRVDELARTDDPAIVAAGDCTNHPNALLNRQLRLESVHNAIEQAKTAAATICGEERPYNQYPWFWSDQFDVKLQMVGIADDYDTVIKRGSIAERRFSFFYFRDGQLTAVDSINRPADHMQARRLLNHGIALSPTQAADPDVSLKDLK